ncbi:MAG: fluoride efflux transporter CrcB [Anaerolineae bacterium]|nr:fluoride efflux transporter CrcB [Anaerolineae bacterium]
METMLIIGAGGFIGANVRYLLATLITRYLGSHFPWGTFVINASGSLLLALFAAWATAHTPDPRLRLFVATGFCGAYTTFSTYSVELLALVQAGHLAAALQYLLLTNLVCLGGAALGLALGSRL